MSLKDTGCMGSNCHPLGVKLNRGYNRVLGVLVPCMIRFWGLQSCLFHLLLMSDIIHKKMRTGIPDFTAWIQFWIILILMTVKVEKEK